MKLCNDSAFDYSRSPLTILWILDPIIRHNCTLHYFKISVSCMTLLLVPRMAKNNNLNTLLSAPSMANNKNLNVCILHNFVICA